MSATIVSDVVERWLGRACESLEKGCCLELYYVGHSVIVELHAVGFDKAGRPAALACKRNESANGPGEWQLIYLDEARKVDVSGYFSEAPRPGFRRGDKRFGEICCQL